LWTGLSHVFSEPSTYNKIIIRASLYNAACFRSFNI
jgi:hypothetical protein